MNLYVGQHPAERAAELTKELVQIQQVCDEAVKRFPAPRSTNYLALVVVSARLNKLVARVRDIQKAELSG